MKFVQICIFILICLALQAFGQAPSATDLPPALVGQDYSGSVTFDAKVSIPFHLDLAGKLPEGLTLNSDGTIRGRATKAETVRFGVFLSDGSGPVASGIFNLQVNNSAVIVAAHRPVSAHASAPMPAHAPAPGRVHGPAPVPATDPAPDSDPTPALGPGSAPSADPAPAPTGGGNCPGAQAARPRIASHLAEGVTKISGTAQATSTGCTTKVRVWLVPNEWQDIVSNSNSVEMLSAHDGDAVVTAQGTWSMELDQALDSGQFIQVEQYFEFDAKDDSGQSQTKVTTFLSATAEEMTKPEAIAKPEKALRQRQRPQTASPNSKKSGNNKKQKGINNPDNQDKGSQAQSQNETESPCAAVLAGGEKMDQSSLDSMCKTLRQVAEKFISVPQVAQGVADWGRVRAYFTSGEVLAHDQGSFSNASMFLAFTLDKNWVLPDYFIDEKIDHRHRAFSFGFNSFFETRLTSVPVSTCTQTGTSTTTSGSQPTDCQKSGSSPDLNTFLTSRKTARMSAGVYMPMLTTRWHYQGAPNALYWAPLIKVGFDTPTESFDTSATNAQSQGTTAAAAATPTTASPVNGDRFYTNYSFGARLGHFKLSSTRDQAPQDISHLDVTIGRFSNLESLVSTSTSTATNILGRQRLWRFQLEGILKIPNTPAVIGFSANIGQRTFGGDNVVKPANDDLRFLFGTKFDVGKLLAKIKGL